MSGNNTSNTFAPSSGKIFFLFGFSILLSSFGPLSIFAPAPVALAFLVFGPKRTFTIGVGFLAALFALTAYSGVTALNTIVLMFSLLYGAIVYAIVKSRMHPSEGIMKSGALLVICFSFLYFASTLVSDFSLEEQMRTGVTTIVEQFKQNKDYSLIMSQTGEEARALQQFIKNPEMALNEILSWLPATLFVTLFFSLWATMFVVMRNSLVWKNFMPYPWKFQDFLRFKAPDVLVYPLIVALVLAVSGDYLLGEQYQVIGFNALYCLGIFYFFQGFGVFLDALTFFKIFGFFRLIFVVSFLFFAWKILVVVGLLDNWMNFRRFFKNKKEGDIL